MEFPSELGWPANQSETINEEIKTAVGPVRVCQKVIPTHPLPAGTPSIPYDVLALPNFRVKESTKVFVEIYSEFPLTSTQAKNEPQSAICRKLAKLAAASVALAEDAILFQGQGVKLPANVKANQLDTAERGLLGAAENDPDDGNPNKVSKPIDVDPAPAPPAGQQRRTLYGENTFTKVAEGISKLVSKGKAPPYALFLPHMVYADTFAAPGDQSLAITADRIRPLVEGGFYGTGTLPSDKGLLIALGGEPVSLYLADEAHIEYVRREGQDHWFSVMERVQFVPLDPRALVLLKFKPVP